MFMMFMMTRGRAVSTQDESEYQFSEETSTSSSFTLWFHRFEDKLKHINVAILDGAHSVYLGWSHFLCSEPLCS